MTESPQNSPSQAPPARRRRGLRLALRIVWAPIAAVLWLCWMLWRAVLFVTALVMVAYFYLSVQYSGVDVLTIVNGAIKGQFQAETLVVSPFADEVVGFDVNLLHPDGRVLVHIDKMVVDFSRKDMIDWALRFLPATLLGTEVDRVLPIHLTRIELEGYTVLLPFEEHGFAFLDAFQPKTVSPPSEEPGLEPEVALENISLGSGKVELVFPFFRMGIGVAGLEGGVWVRDGQPKVSARHVNVHSYQLLGLIPEPASFVGEETSAVFVGNFLLEDTQLGFSDLDVRHPDFRVQGRMGFDFVQPGMPVEASGFFRVTNPQRVESLTMGHVVGTASGTFRMFGLLQEPQFEFGFESPWLMAEEIEVEKIRGTTTLQVMPEVRIGVPELTASVWGADVKANDFLLRVNGSDIRMEFDGCADGLHLASLARQFDIDPLWMLADVPVSACLKQGVLEVPDGEVHLSGNAVVDVQGGEFPTSLGLFGASVFGALDVTLQEVSLKQMRLVSNLASLSGDLAIAFAGEEPLFSVRLAGQAADLSALPNASSLKLGGAIQLDSLLVDGTPANLRIETELTAQRLQLLGSRVENLEVKGSLAEGDARLERFCFDQGGNVGCLAAHAELGPNLGVIPEAFPVSLVVLSPLSLDLSALPFVTLPVQGLVEAGPIDLSATVSSDPMAILDSLRGEATFSVEEGQWGDFVLANANVRIKRSQPKPDAGPLGGLTTWVTTQGFDSPHASVDQMTAYVDLRRFVLGEGVAGINDASAVVQVTVAGVKAGETGLEKGDVQVDLADLRPESWGGIIPGILASGSVSMEGFSQGTEKLKTLDLRFDGSDPLKTVTLQGNIALDQRLKARFEAVVDRVTSMANLKVEANNLPIGLLPALRRYKMVKDLLLETRVTANVDVKNIDLAALVEGQWWKVVQRLSGRGKLLVKNLRRLPEPVEQVQASFRAGGGRIHVDPLDVALTAGGHVVLEGDYTPRVKEAHLTATLDPIRLGALKSLSAISLPLDVSVGGSVSLNGRLPLAALDAQLKVKNLRAVGLELGDADIDVVGTLGEDLWFSSNRFFPGFTLQSGVLAFRDHQPSHLSLVMGFTQFALQRMLPTLPPMLDVKADGTAKMDVRLAPGEEPFTLALDFPPKAATACLTAPPISLCLANEASSAVAVTSQGISTSGLTLSGEGQSLGMKGKLGFETGYAMDLQANLDISWLRMLSQAFAVYTGRLVTTGAGVRLAGALDTPTIRGFLELKDVSLLPRGLGEEIIITSARMGVSGDLKAGNLTVAVTENSPIKGTMDEGEFQISGNVVVQEWLPRTATLVAVGKDLFFQIPGELRLQFSPKLTLKLEDLQDLNLTSGTVSGDVYIAEGDFTRNFDRLLGSFSYALARKQEKYSRPITEILPFLTRIDLNVAVRGGNFNVASRFPFGETELTVELDMRVGGTLDALKLYDRMRVVPGGSLTYKVVKRVFQVVQGSVDFYGDPGAPYLDVRARTEVIYTPPADYVSTWTQEEREWGRPVSIEIHITGTYPNITFELTSDSPEFDVADLQTLLLLGMTRRDLEGRSASGSSDVSINLLTDDVAGMVSKLILGPFIDAMSLGFTQEGGIRAETATKLGRAMSLTTKVRQDSSRSEYSAGFQFRITDWLSLEGKLKMIQEQAESLRNYEAKFRYTIPLE